MVRSKEYDFIQYWDGMHGIELQEMVGIGVLLCLLKMRDQSIILYWVIRCCGWLGGEALSCPDQEVALGVKMNSLKRSYWMSSSRYFRRAHQWMVLYPL